MKLNKKGKRYIEPDAPKPCVITDGNGGYFHPTNAPKGFCKCGVMLMLNPKKVKYTFSSRSRALHAIVHTSKWLKENGFPLEAYKYDNWKIEEL